VKFRPHVWLVVYTMLMHMQNIAIAQQTQIPTLFFTEQNIANNLPFSPIDTSITRSEIFDPVQRQLFMQHLGNLGSPAQSMIFNTQRDVGFHYGFRPFAMYHLHPEQNIYYQTKKPFTDISYAQGKKELIFLNLTHAQNINPRWNMGIRLHRAKADGFQPQTATSLYAFQGFTSYKSRDLRYILLASATWNRAVIQEGGGIQNDSLFETLTGNNKAIFARLDNAENRYRNRSGYVQQHYRWGNKIYAYKDKDTLYDFIPKHQISHTLHAEEEIFLFNQFGNPDLDLLPNVFYDTTTTFSDSAYYGRVQNRISYTYMNKMLVNKRNFFDYDTLYTSLSGGIRHQLINVAQQPYIRLIQNTIADAYLRIGDLRGNAPIHVMGWYALSGYNAGDYYSSLKVGTRTKNLQSDLQFESRSHRPDFVLELFKSNAFIWENNYDQVHAQSIKLHLATRKFKHNLHVTLAQHYLTNYVAVVTNDKLQEASISPQVSPQIMVTQINLQKTFQVGRFYFENEVWLQRSSDAIIQLPQLAAFGRYTYRAKFFSITQFQIGMDVFYNTQWNANSYNPALRMFHTQTAVLVGNYPVINPFIVCEVKKASFFIKYEHLNQDWIRMGMYSTPHYPFSQANLRMGLRWRFYD
jgi:hypothetical protein